MDKDNEMKLCEKVPVHTKLPSIDKQLDLSLIDEKNEDNLSIGRSSIGKQHPRSKQTAKFAGSYPILERSECSSMD